MGSRAHWNTVLLLSAGAILPIALSPTVSLAQSCTPGPNYNNCMNEYRQEQQRQRAQEERERQQQQREEQQRQQAEQRAEQQRQQAEQRAEEQRQQAQQRAEEQRQQTQQRAEEQRLQQQQQRAQEQQERLQQQQQQRAPQQQQNQPPPRAIGQDQQPPQQNQPQRAIGQRQPQQNQPQRTFGGSNPPTAPNQPPRTFGGGNPPTAPNQPPRTFGGGNPPTAPNQPPRTFGGGNPPTAPNQPPRTFGGGNPPTAPNSPPRTFGQQQPQQNLPQRSFGQRQPPASGNTRQVRITQGTTLNVQPDRHELTLTHRAADGSQLVVHRTQSPDGKQQTVAYKQSFDPKTKTQTRIYSDGHKTVTGSNFVERDTRGRNETVKFQNGMRLRSTTVGGRQIFQERLQTVRGKDGRMHQAVVRALYARFRGGRPIFLATPVEEVYEVVPYGGYSLYYYDPYAFPAAFYNPFFVPFASPIRFAVVCPACVTAAAFSQAAQTYLDPNALLGDMQIASGFNDGYAPQDAAPGYSDPGLMDLEEQVDSLRQEVESAEVQNADLRSQIADQQVQLDSLTQVGAQPAPPVQPQPVQVPDDVRAQVQKEVREDIALHQNGQPLELPEILNSPDAQDYVFQFSGVIDAVDSNTAEDCTLSTGDLAVFNRVPNVGEPAAQMKIVTSKPGSCRAGAVVNVGMTDVQDMLNAFSQRLEANMQVVSANLK